MFKGHPKGLMVLFFTEMWERFGFYTMLALFTLYMKHYFGWDTEKSGQVYGLYLAFVYFTPLVGGFIADKFLGYRKTINIGAAILMVGYALLAIPNPTEMFFYMALAVLVIGNGLFKANISVLVGNLYDTNSPLKDAAYNIFYMGINVGAFLAPIAASFLRNKAPLYVKEWFGITVNGFNLAFGAAAVGMLLSLVIFNIYKEFYLDSDRVKHEEASVNGKEISPEQEKERIFALLVIFFIVIFFWMAFHQNGFALTLFADESVRRTVSLFGYTISIPPELYQVFNPLFILILTPVVVGFFGYLAKKGKEPSTPAKIGIGMLLTGFAFMIMVGASLAGGNLDNNSASPMWLISTYLVVTFGELCLSPMGLSFVSKVAPPRMKGLMMGGWFVATAIGNYLAGFVGRYYHVWPHSKFFLLLSVLAFVSFGLVMLSLKKLNHATREEID